MATSTVKVAGKVLQLNKKGEPQALPGVSITCYDARGKLLSNAMTTDKGYNFAFDQKDFPIHIVFPQYHFLQADQKLEVLELNSAAEIEVPKPGEVAKILLTHYGPHPTGNLSNQLAQANQILGEIKALLAEGKTGHLAELVKQVTQQTQKLEALGGLDKRLETLNTSASLLDEKLKILTIGVPIFSKLPPPPPINLDLIKKLISGQQDQWEDAAQSLRTADSELFGANGERVAQDEILAEFRRRLAAAANVAQLEVVWRSNKQVELDRLKKAEPSQLTVETALAIQANAIQRYASAATDVIDKIEGLRLAVLALEFSPRLQPGEFNRYRPLVGRLEQLRAELIEDLKIAKVEKAAA